MGLAAGSPTIAQTAGTLISGGTGIATAAAAGASLTIPIIGAALGVVTLAIEAIVNSGCGQSCVITSNWANEAENQLQNNISEYFSIPAPRPQSAQSTAIQNFMTVWNYLYQECSAASLGQPGADCIEDRQSGACKWKQTSDSPLLAYPGEPQPGQCWNWWNGYHDPIANDPDVVSDATYAANLAAASSASTSSTSTAAGTSTTSMASTATSSSSVSPILLMAGAALLLFAFAGGN